MDARMSKACTVMFQWLHRKSKADQQPTPLTSAGISRLELLADRQAQTLQTFERQLTKVQLKTRLMGHDVRPVLRKVGKQENIFHQPDTPLAGTSVSICCCS